MTELNRWQELVITGKAKVDELMEQGYQNDQLYDFVYEAAFSLVDDLTDIETYQILIARPLFGGFTPSEDAETLDNVIEEAICDLLRDVMIDYMHTQTEKIVEDQE